MGDARALSANGIRRVREVRRVGVLCIQKKIANSAEAKGGRNRVEGVRGVERVGA